MQRVQFQQQFVPRVSRRRHGNHRLMSLFTNSRPGAAGHCRFNNRHGRTANDKRLTSLTLITWDEKYVIPLTTVTAAML